MSNAYHRAVKLCGQQAVSQALSDMIYEEQRRRLQALAPDISKRKIQKIEDLSEWLKYYGFTPESIRSKCRLRKIINIRKALCYYLTELNNLSLKDTANMLGYIDHTTVMHHRDDFGGLISIGDKDALKMLATLVKQNEPETV
jgi:chromosomal replication initiation ATPase DnaA